MKTFIIALLGLVGGAFGQVGDDQTQVQPGQDFQQFQPGQDFQQFQPGQGQFQPGQRGRGRGRGRNQVTGTNIPVSGLTGLNARQQQRFQRLFPRGIPQAFAESVSNYVQNPPATDGTATEGATGQQPGQGAGFQPGLGGQDGFGGQQPGFGGQGPGQGGGGDIGFNADDFFRGDANGGNRKLRSLRSMQEATTEEAPAAATTPTDDEAAEVTDEPETVDIDDLAGLSDTFKAGLKRLFGNVQLPERVAIWLEDRLGNGAEEGETTDSPAEATEEAEPAPST